MRVTGLVLAVLLVTTGLAGCIGDDGESLDPTQTNATNGSATAADTPGTNATNDTPASNRTPVSDDGAPEEPAGTNGTDSRNPWQAGLADSYPTPDIAEHRSADERRSDVAEPGDPEFAAFDARMTAWMEQHNISAGQLAITKDGELRYESGYGFTDRAGDEPTKTSTMFRIASVTKPMLKAVVSMQVEQGLYNWTDPVFCLPADDPPADCRLPIEPAPANPVEDDRLTEIQVQHLVNHTAGWDNSANNLQFGQGAVDLARTLGVEPPASAWRTAQYLMGTSLEFDPGEEERYCNVCYMLAGLVAEAETGASLQALYDAYLFEPLGIEHDIEVGRTLPSERNPREPFYACEETHTSVFEPDKTVCAPDGGWSTKLYRGQGGLVATASAVAAVYDVYAHHADTWEEAYRPYTWRWFDGSLPGTTSATFTLSEGQDVAGQVQFAVLFNGGGKGGPCQTVQEDLGSDEGCRRTDLYKTMQNLTTTWGAADEATSSAGGFP